MSPYVNYKFYRISNPENLLNARDIKYLIIIKAKNFTKNFKISVDTESEITSRNYNFDLNYILRIKN